MSFKVKKDNKKIKLKLRLVYLLISSNKNRIGSSILKMLITIRGQDFAIVEFKILTSEV